MHTIFRKRLYPEMNEGKLKGQEAIDNGLMELLEEKGKNVPDKYIEPFAEYSPLYKE